MSDLERNAPKFIALFRHGLRKNVPKADPRRLAASLRGFQQNLVRIHKPTLLFGNFFCLLFRLHINLILLKFPGPLLLGRNLLLQIFLFGRIRKI